MTKWLHSRTARVQHTQFFILSMFVHILRAVNANSSNSIWIFITHENNWTIHIKFNSFWDNWLCALRSMPLVHYKQIDTGVRAHAEGERICIDIRADALMLCMHIYGWMLEVPSLHCLCCVFAHTGCLLSYIIQLLYIFSEISYYCLGVKALAASELDLNLHIL